MMSFRWLEQLDSVLESEDFVKLSSGNQFCVHVTLENLRRQSFSAGLFFKQLSDFELVRGVFVSW